MPDPAPSPSRVLVVGAGVAGLIAARELTDAGIEVTVVDKGRAVGGRLASRRVGDATFDHGAQFLTVKDDTVRPLVERWERDGLVTTWFRGSPDLDGDEEPDDGHPRYRGVPTMRSIAEHLAEQLDVRLGVRVRHLRPDPAGWRLTADPVDHGDRVHLTADAVLLTPPAPQTLDLLDAGDVVLSERVHHELTSVTFDPSLAVLAVPDGPTSLPNEGALRLMEGPAVWIADGLRKGSSATPAVVVHGAPGASRDLWSASDSEVAGELLAAARPHLGVDATAVRVHRWRYARPTSSSDAPAWLDHAPAPIAFAGDAFTAGRVEGAIVSGRAAAHLLRGTLDR